MFKNKVVRDFGKIKAGSIESLKEVIKYKLKPFVKEPNKHYNVSLLGIGHTYKETNSLNGIYQIELVANNFINKDKYFANITNNGYVEVIVKN